MNSKELLKNIEIYVEHKDCKYAVMIDGEWGVGKTYFYDKSIKSLIVSKNLKPIYISLFGAEDIESVNETIFCEIIKSVKYKKFKGKREKILIRIKFYWKNSIISRVFPIVLQNSKLIKSVTKEYLSNFKNINITSNYINYVIDNMLNNTFVLIFDDFERATIDTMELLGYISQFIEQRGIKTLIIANQKEIRSYEKYKNIELKYLVALNENTPENSDINKSHQNNKDNKECFESKLKQLNYKVDSVFSNDRLYKLVNEKVIGKVLRYTPDLDETIRSDLLNYTNEYIQYIDIDKVIDFIVNVFDIEEHNNIRTYKLIMENFDFYYSLITLESSKKDGEYLYEVFKCIVYCTVLYKKTGDIKVDSKGQIGPNGYDSFDEYYKKRWRLKQDFYTLPSVIEFVKIGSFDDIIVQREYNEHLIRKENTMEYKDAWDIEGLLYDWVIFSDSKMETAIEDIRVKVFEETFAFVSALLALKYLYKFNFEFGFEIDYLDQLESEIVKHINESKIQRRVIINSYYPISLFTGCTPKFENKRDEFSKLIEKRNNELVAKLFEYNVGCYGKEFIKNFDRRKNGELSREIDIKDMIDLGELKTLILEGDNENLLNFWQGVRYMYFEYVFTKDIDFYDKLILILKNSKGDCTEKNKKGMLDRIIKDLEKSRENIRT